MTISNSHHSKHHDRLGYSFNDSEDKAFVSAAHTGGHFQTFRLRFRLWHVCHVHRGQVALNQIRLSVLNGMHGNHY